MLRRSFIESCSATAACAACASALLPLRAMSTEARPRAYARTLLVNDRNEPLRASKLTAKANYIFHYPFESTPVFLLNLGRAALPEAMSAGSRAYAYAWPGGVGSQKSVVAYCAICTHQLGYPSSQETAISYRRTRAVKGVQDELIHCCDDHSQFDPARGAEVLAGPAQQPLCTVLLEHDAKADTLTAWGTLGSEMFDAFFRRHDAKLKAEFGAGARNPVSGRAVVRELEKFCRKSIAC